MRFKNYPTVRASSQLMLSSGLVFYFTHILQQALAADMHSLADNTLESQINLHDSESGSLNSTIYQNDTDGKEILVNFENPLELTSLPVQLVKQDNLEAESNYSDDDKNAIEIPEASSSSTPLLVLGSVLLTGGVIAIANESGSDSSHTSVSSNDSLDVPIITVTDVTVREGQGPAEVQVQLSEIQESDITVKFSVISGTASLKSDYSLLDAEKDVSSHNLYEVTIPAGQREAVITIGLSDDGFAEKNESFYMLLHESKDFDLEKSLKKSEL